MPRGVLVWVYGPWMAACLVMVMAIRLLIDEQFSPHGHGWGLVGSGAICFSIGCVCKVTWELARFSRMREQERVLMQQVSGR